ncbi:LysE family translocator [Chitinasiproducens palmae]|uniref:Threonine/homoserine/homoserine lactone efflux protein n=1 Tax=Chitinasiproducens palmae TaxID=1770053 RepID=A0A1H2PQL3_9BURK|nr:LysE family translocator [Chitinasiproducens palmae]SDV48296.1 Threonine/homoserine/homoserine lactone efflux protein [Chitinasiproducens palmae]
MSLHAWLAFVGASILLLLIPGPTILLVISDALSNKGRSPVSTIAGVSAGDCTAMAVSLAGAGALLAASATAFVALKVVGGAYLIFLGLRSIAKARRAGRHAELSASPKSAVRRFLSAWAVTALNPKGIVFFVAFVPQFVSPNASFASQAAIMLCTFVCLSTLNSTVYGLIARVAARRLAGEKVQRRVGVLGGAVLVGAGTLTIGLQH